MWTPQFIETTRGSFEFFVRGEGEPICVTHLYSAYNEKGNAFANPFTEHYTVYLVNLRGAGNSVGSVNKDDLSMKESIKDLEAIRTALKFEKWAFAGHSTGGMLGLVYAIQAPDSLTKMVIGGAAASKEYMHHPGSIYCEKNLNNERIGEIIRTINNPTIPAEEKSPLSREWTEMSLYRPENYEQYFNKPNSGSTVPQRLDYYSYTELPNYDLTDQLSAISIPTTVYCGLHDAQCPRVFSVQIANAIPNAQLITFDESNHLPFTEEPEKFASMIARQVK
ncbi:alpha/beta fold hydrolase [Sporosarcina sp. FSL K6-5500]|uniref:alpha/beta fold hydrolase n=1 Tax=Sporosarcina sp. FSL K6-5500 TaxID=2921558 RepID=UPI0030F540D9